MKNIVIIGASGHGSVVLDCIEREGIHDVAGFIDSFQKKGTKKFGYEVLGDESDLPLIIEKYGIVGGIVAIGDNWTRSEMVHKIVRIVKDFNFISVIHPDASIGKGVEMGKGTTIMPGAVINCNAKVGDFCIVNTNASLGHDGVLSNFSSLSPGVCVGGNFKLGMFSAISLGAKIIENITIGAHSVIGAGSLVLNDIHDRVLAYGSPAHIIRKRLVGESYLGNISKSRFEEIVLKTSNDVNGVSVQ